MFVDGDGFNRIMWCSDDSMMVEKKDDEEEKTEEAETGAPTSVRGTTIDKPTSSSSITIDPTTLDEKEEFQLKEAIKKAMLDEKG